MEFQCQEELGQHTFQKHEVLKQEAPPCTNVKKPKNARCDAIIQSITNVFFKTE